MVLGSPRCGTAWAAEWLGAVHDPLWDTFYLDLDRLDTGISCTGVAQFWEWCNRHPAPKVILHRPALEVASSLRLMGLPHCPQAVFEGLEKVEGLHVRWTDLWRKPHAIWERLRPGERFDGERHALLKGVNIQADWQRRLETVNARTRYRMAMHTR